MGTQLRCYLGICIFLAFGCECRAQMYSTLGGYTPGQEMPGAPAGAYALSSFETYNPANRLLNIGIPLVTIGGRGTIRAPLVVSVTPQPWSGYAWAYLDSGCQPSDCQVYWSRAMRQSWDPWSGPVLLPNCRGLLHKRRRPDAMEHDVDTRRLRCCRWHPDRVYRQADEWHAGARQCKLQSRNCILCGRRFDGHIYFVGRCHR